MASEKRLSGTAGLPRVSEGSGLQRLPTLAEVLMRKTRPPLDLFCFYIFLQQENAEDTLDFWLDVQQHENMCRAYFKDVRKSGAPIHRAWPEYYEYARTHGSIYAAHAGINVGEEPELGLERGEAGGVGDLETTGGMSGEGGYAGDAREGTMQRQQRDPPRAQAGHDDSGRSGLQPAPTAGSPSLMDGASPPLSPDPTSASSHHSPRFPPSTYPGRNTQLTAGAGEDGTRAPSRASYGGSLFGKGNRRVSRAPTVIPRSQAIRVEDLVQSGERIFARYLVGGAEKEIYLPPSLRIHEFPSTPHAHSPADPRIPDYFHPAKTYIFKALEEDAFPRFLRAKAFSNLTRLSSGLSLVGGLFCLWAGFVVAFTLVFLDYTPKIRRLYLIIPFFLAFYLLFSAAYHLSPLLAVLDQSETRPFQTIRIREAYVRKLLLGRAATVMLWVVLSTGVMTVVWWAVPGRRL